jgi:hypothetical protein
MYSCCALYIVYKLGFWIMLTIFSCLSYYDIPYILCIFKFENFCLCAFEIKDLFWLWRPTCPSIYLLFTSVTMNLHIECLKIWSCYGWLWGSIHTKRDPMDYVNTWGWDLLYCETWRLIHLIRLINHPMRILCG